jgi:hypothetical protein
MLAVLFNVVSLAIEGAVVLYLVEGLVTLESEGVPASQLQAMAGNAIEMHGYGFGAALIFFGFEC